MNSTLSLSRPVSRLAALALLAAVLFLAYAFIAAPLVEEFENSRSAAQRLRDAVDRRDAFDQKLSQLKAELARLKESQTSSVGFIAGTNESLAGVDLTNRIKTSVEGAKGELRSTQNLPGRDDGAFRRISVRAQIAVKLSGVQRVFYELESGSPFLFLDSIEMRTQAAYQIAPNATDDPVLEVRFDLYGYMRRPS